MTDDHTLINLRRIHIVRHLNLQISKNTFLDKDYFSKKRKPHSLAAALRGEELEPHERETLTYGS